jgi:hypothetical protein
MFMFRDTGHLTPLILGVPLVQDVIIASILLIIFDSDSPEAPTLHKVYINRIQSL